MRNISPKLFTPANRCLLLALSGGLLLHLSWFPNGLTVLVFIAFVPFLFLAQRCQAHSLPAFGYFFAGFFLFHLFSGWWMYSSTIPGSLMAHLFNAAYMSVVLVVWMKVSGLKSFRSVRLVALILFWLAFERLHQQWELAWPWFTLGHALAPQSNWIQWYQFTGSPGGSAWILLVNGLIFYLVKAIIDQNRHDILLRLPALCLVFTGPVLISFLIENQAVDTSTYLRVMVVQPNIHPQREKFAGMSASDQLDKALQLVQQQDLNGMGLILFPETMLVDAVDEAHPADSPLVRRLISLVPHATKTVITGTYSSRLAGWHTSDHKAVIHDSVASVLYNSAMLIHRDGVYFYHKEKLVPLVEKQPFGRFMQPLQAYIERSGGFFGSYGTHNTQKVFYTADSIAILPLICFESAFNFEAAKASARPSLITILTNDGWWSDAGGYSQHLELARLRAIENGKWVVRSANTGVSAVIDPSGKVIKHCDYGMEGVIIFDVPLVAGRTFFAQHSDFLQVIPVWMALFAGLYWFLAGRQRSLKGS